MSGENFAVLGADDIPTDDDSLAIRPEEMGGEAAPAPEPDLEASSTTEEPSHEPEHQEPEPEEQQAGESGQSQEAQSQAEPEAEPEPVAADGGSAEPEPEPAGAPDPVTVPKARLDKALRDKRALEQRIQQFESQYQQQPAPPPAAQSAEAQPPQPTQPVEAELPSSKEIAEALLDGDLEKYAELMDKRDVARDQQLMQQINQTVPLQVDHQQQRLAFDQVRAELETQYSFLDSNSDDFDQELTNTVVTFTSTYRDQGYTSADALQMAADKVLKIEKPELFQVQPEAPKVNPKVEQLKQERMNIDQKLQAAAAQTPKVTAAAVDDVDPVPDFTSISDEDFDKLTPTQLDEYMARMRDQRMGR